MRLINGQTKAIKKCEKCGYETSDEAINVCPLCDAELKEEVSETPVTESEVTSDVLQNPEDDPVSDEATEGSEEGSENDEAAGEASKPKAG